MGCLFAFLSTTIKHLVILGSVQTSTDPYYYKYKVSEIRFPAPQHGSDITFYNVEMKNENTLTGIYCSPTKSGPTIKQVIFGDLHDATTLHEDPPGVHHSTITHCFMYISSQARQMNPSQSVTVSSLLSNHVNSGCTSLIIASLAFQRRIVMEGKYKCFAPPAVAHWSYTNADQPLKMEDILSHSEMVLAMETSSGTRVLVWYQGHLHIFMRKSYLMKVKWYPVTKIGSESENGQLIHDFVSEKFYHSILKEMKKRDIRNFNAVINAVSDDFSRSDMWASTGVLEKYKNKDVDLVVGEKRNVRLVGQLC
ncbi:unnamed protein product [Blumeria hordei]|uniref:Uncharacterized protein n=1 Tax=Blumeria hordei TaxID=2867405 RepID=A0A383V1N3_BLUHO|nr:unnamed protein product [Blumeria hordei]